MAVAAFHFHGYQPGDIVRWIEPDPLKPPRFEERNSPVSHRIGHERILGRNWTDAVLHAYGRMEAVLERVPGVASVDIEPQTLAWLLEKDGDAYRRVLAAWERGVAGLVMTPPFHPILPHHHRQEREVLFDMMFDFYARPLRRTEGNPIGLWLPEAAYSADTMRDFAAAARRASTDHDGLHDLVPRVYLLMDRRQIAHPEAGTAWYHMVGDGGMPVVVRDPPLSGDFAFGSTQAAAFASTAKSRHSESLLVASDLESLLANAAQAERFESIVRALTAEGFMVAVPTPPSTTIAATPLDHSSWSDYEEHLHRGHTSDTRWTGLRRSDGLVVSRNHRGEPMSQLWKHALTLATEQIETAIRRTARELLRAFEFERRGELLRRLAVAYGRHVFREHYRANGLSSADVDFAEAAQAILGGRVDVELAAHLARGYTTMLMGLRSDPRFWDNPDTRVTFQNVACLAQALVDVAKACHLAGEADHATRLVRLLRATLLEFSEAYGRKGFSELHGVEGWETTEAAWLRSLQSDVTFRSEYDVVRRAVLFAVGEALRDAHHVPARTEDVVADTGHIAGEAHGEWGNRNWCEHSVPFREPDNLRG